MIFGAKAEHASMDGKQRNTPLCVQGNRGAEAAMDTASNLYQGHSSLLASTAPRL
jgi:hypothetical protein